MVTVQEFSRYKNKMEKGKETTLEAVSLFVYKLSLNFVLWLDQGGTTQVRFQPHLGRYLAAAAENVVSILDAETQTCQHLLKVSVIFL